MDDYEVIEMHGVQSLECRFPRIGFRDWASLSFEYLGGVQGTLPTAS